MNYIREYELGLQLSNVLNGIPILVIELSTAPVPLRCEVVYIEEIPATSNDAELWSIPRMTHRIVDHRHWCQVAVTHNDATQIVEAMVDMSITPPLTLVVGIALALRRVDDVS